MGKVPDNVHSAMRELQRRGQIRGFDALILWACRMFYVGMMVWCALFIYQKFGQFKLNAIYPVVVAIVLVNMAYNTVVQLVAWSAFYRKPVNIDDLYEQMPKE